MFVATCFHLVIILIFAEPYCTYSYLLTGFLNIRLLFSSQIYLWRLYRSRAIHYADSKTETHIQFHIFSVPSQVIP